MGIAPDPAYRPEANKQQIKEIRCRCGKLLLISKKQKGSEIEIKCKGCKTVNTITV